MTLVYSITGKPVDLGEASISALAEVLNGLDDEESKIKERKAIITRELAKRMDGKRSLRSDGWQIVLRQYASVIRVSA